MSLYGGHELVGWYWGWVVWYKGRWLCRLAMGDIVVGAVCLVYGVASNGAGWEGDGVVGSLSTIPPITAVDTSSSNGIFK